MNIFNLPNSVYDKIKLLVTIVLPAIGTLYLALSQIWSLSYAEEVTTTIVVVCTFLGTVLGISSKKYEIPTQGELMVMGANQSVVVAFDEDPGALVPGNIVQFRVGEPIAAGPQDEHGS